MASASVKAHGFSALPAEVLTLIINRLDSDNVGLRALRAAYKHPAVSTETARKLFKDLILRVRFDAQETGHVRDPRGIGDVLKFVQSTTFVDNSRRAPPEDCCRQWELCYAVAWIKLRLPEHSIVSYMYKTSLSAWVGGGSTDSHIGGSADFRPRSTSVALRSA